MPSADFTSTLTGIPALTPSAGVQTGPGKGKGGKTAAPYAAPLQGIAAVQTALEQIRENLANPARSLEFQGDPATGLVVVSIKDARTGELIRQIPGNAILHLADTLTVRDSGPQALVDLTA